MATLFPGAIWRPIPVSSSRPRRGKGRAVVLHVAVSEGASLFNIFSTSGNDSHLYVRKDGTLEQYIDLDLVAYASIAANANTISVETQGGVVNADAEPWTDAQVATLARIARWAHDTEGVPLSLMPNSLPASKGIGYHRLGIDPWRVPGGEVWSSSRGKLCPGAAKIAQVPQIIALANQGDDMPLTDADAAVIWNHILGVRNGSGPATAADWLRDGRVDAGQAIAQLTGTNVGAFSADVRGDLANKAKQLDAIQAAVGKTADPAVLAEAVVTAMGTEFAQKVIDALGQRINATQPPAA